MIIHINDRIIVMFGHGDVASAMGVVPGLPFIRQETGLWYDEPDLSSLPDSAWVRATGAILRLDEIVPQQRDADGKFPVSDEAAADVMDSRGSVELRFPDLRSIDTVIGWLTELRTEFAAQSTTQRLDEPMKDH